MTLSNYDQITTRMTKAQVERILGPPTTVETKDMMIFKKTTYRYEDGEKFAMFTFKNDGLGSEEGKSSVRTITVDFGRATGIASRSLRRWNLRHPHGFSANIKAPARKLGSLADPLASNTKTNK